jgi:DNA modification methylase
MSLKKIGENISAHTGDCLDILKLMPANSVQMAVTSPPYFGLRDYGVAGQIGLEETPEEYVAKLVAIFHEVKRVLKDDGVLFVNLGDSYASNGKKGGDIDKDDGMDVERGRGRLNNHSIIKPKDLIGIPWRVAFALQADGWYLRQDIIWQKPNPMPESVKDRCTKSHEYIFLLAKNARYYFDNEAISEPAKQCSIERLAGAISNKNKWVNGAHGQTKHTNCQPRENYKQLKSKDPEKFAESDHIAASWENCVNKRSVWSINTKPYKEAHFATFPLEIPELCIKAGSREGDIVLDPFSGAGTTGVACIKHRRKYIGIELNPEYIEISKTRLENAIEEFGTPLLDLI